MNSSSWQPTKYRWHRGALRAFGVRPASRLMADLVGEYYTDTIPELVSGDLLDLGCGQAPLYAAYGTHAASVTTADWIAGAHVDVVADLTTALPFDDGQFDTVILSDVLEHLPNPTVVLGEIARVLRPDGVLLLNVPFLYPVHEAPHDYHRYTEFALARMVDGAGLTMIELRPLGGLAEVLCDLTAKGASTVPLLGPLVAKVVQRLGWLLHTSAAGRALGSRTTAYTPSAYALSARKPAA